MGISEDARARITLVAGPLAGRERWAPTPPLILALSSYEPVNWTVRAVLGALIERILVNGYHDQRVTAPEGVAVELLTGSGWLGGHAYARPASSGGSDTPRLVPELERRTSRRLSSFAGCYQGTAFELGQ